jgi:hypothetical protein
MTSPRKRQANRVNALKSTGPKSPAGMRTASLNATSHGLSVATDPEFLDPAAESVALLIASDGIAPALARELAAKVIDYERNMAHQRALCVLPQQLTPGNKEQGRTNQVVPHNDNSDKILGDFEWNLPPPDMEIPRGMKGLTLLAQRLFARVQKMQLKANKTKAVASKRYMLRATNQLIKALKGLKSS